MISFCLIVCHYSFMFNCCFTFVYHVCHIYSAYYIKVAERCHKTLDIFHIPVFLRICKTSIPHTFLVYISTNSFVMLFKPFSSSSIHPGLASTTFSGLTIKYSSYQYFSYLTAYIAPLSTVFVLETYLIHDLFTDLWIRLPVLISALPKIRSYLLVLYSVLSNNILDRSEESDFYLSKIPPSRCPILQAVK